MNLKNLSVFVLAMVFSLTTATVQLASAETYMGVGLGVSIPHEVNDVGASASGFTISLQDVEPDNSFVYGFKLGHFFSSLPWIGAEFNFSQSDPDIDKESTFATITNSPTGAFVGQTSNAFLLSADVANFSSFGFLAKLRPTKEQIEMYSWGKLEPVLGLGFAVNHIDVDRGIVFSTAGTEIGRTASGDSDTDIGILVSAGLNYKVSDSISAYGEYKYTEMSFELDGMDEGVNYSGDIQGSEILFGLAYSF